MAEYGDGSGALCGPARPGGLPRAPPATRAEIWAQWAPASAWLERAPALSSTSYAPGPVPAAPYRAPGPSSRPPAAWQAPTWRG